MEIGPVMSNQWTGFYVIAASVMGELAARIGYGRCRRGSVGRGRGIKWNWTGPKGFRMMLLWLLAAMAGVLFVEGGAGHWALSAPDLSASALRQLVQKLVYKTLLQ